MPKLRKNLCEPHFADDPGKVEVYKCNPFYSLPVRIGNWNNILAIEEAKISLTAYKNNHCQLLVAKTRTMLKNVLEPVVMSTAIENVLYGNYYQIIASELPTTIKSKKGERVTKGLYLSGLINERDIDHGVNFMHGCMVTASPDKSPCKRNTFRFLSSDGKTGTINYGEDFFIGISMPENQPPLYLQAECNNIDSFGGHLICRLSMTPDVYCHFKILHWHPGMRKDSLDSKVMPNAAVVIQHVASGRFLAAEIQNWVPTFFGAECVVSCHIYQNANRMQTAENIWKICGLREPDLGMIIRAAKGEDIPPELLE